MGPSKILGFSVALRARFQLQLLSGSGFAQCRIGSPGPGKLPGASSGS